MLENNVYDSSLGFMKELTQHATILRLARSIMIRHIWPHF